MHGFTAKAIIVFLKEAYVFGILKNAWHETGVSQVALVNPCTYK